MSARVYRYEVPVDDAEHTHRLSGAILHVAARQIDVVEFWAIATDGPEHESTFQVFGTGHALPQWATANQFRGSVIVADGALVWHLFEKPAPVPVVKDTAEHPALRGGTVWD